MHFTLFARQSTCRYNLDAPRGRMERRKRAVENSKPLTDGAVDGGVKCDQRRKSARAKKTEPPYERSGPKSLEPTRFGDWERNGRCIDF